MHLIHVKSKSSSEKFGFEFFLHKQKTTFQVITVAVCATREELKSDANKGKIKEYLHDSFFLLTALNASLFPFFFLSRSMSCEKKHETLTMSMATLTMADL